MVVAALAGSVEPRIFTPPLRDLSDHDASWGHDMIWFAREQLKEPLSPWQEWAVVHAFEILTEGEAMSRAQDENERAVVRELYRPSARRVKRPIPVGQLRFKTILFMVSRQNGKTHLIKSVLKWAMFRKRMPEIMAAAQDFQNAAQLWREVRDEVEEHPSLSTKIHEPRNAHGSEELVTKAGSRYRPVGVSRNAGRGKTNNLLYADELREYKTKDGWNSLSSTTISPPNGLRVITSNAGDYRSVVLKPMRDNAVRAAAAGDTELASTFIAEWSADPDADIDDREAWAQANPDLGNGRITEADLIAERENKDDDSFRTENLCQWVDDLERSDFVPLVDPGLWASFGVDVMPDQTERCLGVEVSPDGERVVLVSGGLVADSAHLEVHPQSGEFDVDETLELIRRYRGTVGQRFVSPGVVEPGDGNSPLAVILDPSTPSILLEPGLKQMGCDPVMVSGPQVSASYQWFMSELRAGKVTHDGNALWQAAWSVAERRSGTDGKWPSFDRFTGDVGVLVAAAFAVWGLAEFKPRRPGRDVAADKKRLIPTGAVRGGAIRGRERVGAF